MERSIITLVALTLTTLILAGCAGSSRTIVRHAPGYSYEEHTGKDDMGRETQVIHEDIQPGAMPYGYAPGGYLPGAMPTFGTDRRDPVFQPDMECLVDEQGHRLECHESGTSGVIVRSRGGSYYTGSMNDSNVREQVLRNTQATQVLGNEIKEQGKCLKKGTCQKR